MSSPEIAWRFATQGRIAFERLGLGLAKEAPCPELPSALQHVSLLHAEVSDPTPYVRAADNVVAGRIHIFANSDADIGHPPHWNKDPKTGTVAPLQFGKTLNYRDPGLVGDIKYLWEPNRHLQLVTLAQAYRFTRNTAYLEGFKIQLVSWLDQCPYPLGPNWTSSLELAVRLINWSLAWDLIGGLGCPLFETGHGARFRDRWLSSIFQHAHFIRHHLSRHSSANNHLIGELAGLVVAGCAWPYWSSLRRWRDGAWSQLQREFLTQHTPDGVNREQATWYQQFSMDFAVHSLLWARHAGLEPRAALWDRLAECMHFIAALTDYGGNVPQLGDADDGLVSKLSQEPDFDPFRSMIALGAVWFRDPYLALKSKKPDDRVLQLLGPKAMDAIPNSASLAESRGPRRTFDAGGIYILGTRLDTPEEVRAVVDVAPLGYLAIAAHGHADALSFTLSVGGEPVLVDPGTFAYHTEHFWRRYFRGTSAHNTVRVDGLDQSVQGGSFMWTHHANARRDKAEFSEDAQVLVGSHDGYARLADPVTHQRALTLTTGSGPTRLLVEDHLYCKAEHSIERFWHFSDSCAISRDAARLDVHSSAGTLRIQLATSAREIQILRGDEHQPAGWVSPSFDVKIPSTTVVERLHIRGDSTLTATILCP